MGGGGVGCAVEAAFVGVDGPDWTGRADDEVAQVCMGETHAEIQQRLPEFVDLLPQSIAYGGRLLGVFGDTGPQRATFDVWVHQERIESQQSPAIFDAGDGTRRGDAGLDEPMREIPSLPGSRRLDQ